MVTAAVERIAERTGVSARSGVSWNVYLKTPVRVQAPDR